MMAVENCSIQDKEVTGDNPTDTRVLLVDEESVEGNHLQSSLIYRYLTWTFKYVETRGHARLSKKAIVSRIFQMILLLVSWTYAIYQCYQYLTILAFQIKYSGFPINYFVFGLHSLVWENRFVVLQTIGLFLLLRHYQHLEDTIHKTYALANVFEESHKVEVLLSIKKAERKYNISFVTVLAFILISQLSIKVVPMAVEVITSQPSHWNSNIECMEIIASVFTIVLALPFVLYFLKITHIYEEYLKVFERYVGMQNVFQIKDCDISSMYIKIHKDISKFNCTSRIYLAYVMVFLVLGGSLTIYTQVISIVDMYSLRNLPDFPVRMTENVVRLVNNSFQAIVLFIWPLMVASSLATAQKNVVPNILEQATEDRKEKLVQEAQHILMFQKTRGVGFNVFGTSVTKWKTLFLTVLGPLIKTLISHL